MAVELFLIMVLLLGGLALARNELWRAFRKEKIDPLQKELEKKQSALSRAKQEHDEALSLSLLFDRDFGPEIRKHRRMKSEGYDEIKPIKQQKSEEIEEIRRLRRKLSSWHSASRRRSGKIKDDSLLGAFGLELTLAQKESLQRDIGRSSDHIDDLGERIDAIYRSKINPANDAIDRIFKDKRRLEEARDAGDDVMKAKKRAEAAGARMAEYMADIAYLTAKIAEAKKAFRTNLFRRAQLDQVSRKSTSGR